MPRTKASSSIRFRSSRDQDNIGGPSHARRCFERPERDADFRHVTDGSLLQRVANRTPREDEVSRVGSVLASNGNGFSDFDDDGAESCLAEYLRGVDRVGQCGEARGGVLKFTRRPGHKRRQGFERGHAVTVRFERATSKEGDAASWAQTAVLAAALTKLTDKGYANLTVEDIARRTGVHKTTIYRRWGDLQALLLDTMTEHAEMDIPIPDTGSIEEDLRGLASSFIDWITSATGRAILAVLLSDAARIPQIAEIPRRLYEAGPQRAAPMITAAVDRGELPADVDPAVLVQTLLAPIFFDLVVTGVPVNEKTAGHAAAITLAAAQADLLKAR
ncbi:TetR/AcrR family transcriptional regulator [Kibdelosporangium philippinense]|uniref:TetR/AcrR family transcriptional regulator n=1 Tax=Kibdelosporangium philippinense TaxID=211113 RepID=A0ABS8Z4Y0_9PSEU|nr:TetR/AcrR family transcriptional regulator [Kibdelosporangium philippinense]MCE7002963.1 TetR/AcrR family transcriptional regulator [Kibdelosporangium philippinense]